MTDAPTTEQLMELLTGLIEERQESRDTIVFPPEIVIFDDQQAEYRAALTALQSRIGELERERNEALHAAGLLHPATAGVMADYQQQLRDRAERAEAECGELRRLFRRKMREWAYYGEPDVDEFLLEAHRAALSEEPRQTHGRDCPCTPCRCWDWDAIDRALSEEPQAAAHLDDESELGPRDPKHPRHHEVMSALHDSRERGGTT